MKVRKKPYKRNWTKNILKAISNNKNYASEISLYLNKSQPDTHYKLIILEKEGFLFSKKIKKNNKRIFKLTKKGEILLSYFNDFGLLKEIYKNLHRYYKNLLK